MPPIGKVPVIPSKIISRASSRKAYSGISSMDESSIEPVSKAAVIKKNKDLYSSGTLQHSRINDYKEEYRHYYTLEQEFEESLLKADSDDAFLENLITILGQVNEVIEALKKFDDVFHTDYTQDVIQYEKHFEKALGDAGILLHVDGILGYFKGRLKRLYSESPESFSFLIQPPHRFLQGLMELFRTIKAVIPVRIEELSTADDQHGAIIDRKL